MREPVSFEISLTGDVTGDKWFGKFKCKTFLSHRDQLASDRIKRELLGAGDAERGAVNRAHIFAQLRVRLVDAPDWWKASDGGLDLVDDNVLVEIFEQTMKAENDALAEIQKKSETAKDELKKISATP
jgi:hypothetical protein